MFGDVVLDIPKKKFEHIFDGVKAAREGQVRLRTPARRAQEDHRRVQEAGEEGDRQGLPAGPAGSARRRPATPSSAAGRTSAPRPIAASTTSTTGSAPPSTCRAWSSATWARTPAPAWASPAIPPPASTSLLRRVPDERAGRRRGLRRPHAAFHQRARQAPCPRSTSSCAPSPASWKSTTATCRTSSSPSRMASSTCCRRATASAPAWPLSASPSTWCDEGLITQEEAIIRVEPNQLYDFLVPRLVEKGEKIEVLATGLPASPGAAVGQIVFTAEDAVKHHAERRLQVHHPGPRRNHA